MTATVTAAMIRALVAAYPGQFVTRELAALLPTDPRDTTAKQRYRRVANQVNPMLRGQKRMTPLLVADAQGRLSLARAPMDKSPAACAARQRAIRDRRNAKGRAATAARKAAHPPKTPAHKRVTVTQAIRPALPFNSAPIAPPNGQARHDARPAREVLPCTEAFLRAHPDKHEVLPTFWSRP